jgi:hypothetical protein
MVASTPTGEQRPTRSLTQVRTALLNAAIDPGGHGNAVALIAVEGLQQKPHDKEQPVHHSPGGISQESVASRTGRETRPVNRHCEKYIPRQCFRSLAAKCPN